MEFPKLYIEYLVVALEIAGATIIILGALWATGYAVVSIPKKSTNNKKVYQEFRRKLGEGILLGLEFLVAADIIKSVTIEPTLRSVTVLAVIVLVRTFLSFTLEVEMTGRWPWQGKTRMKAEDEV